MFAQIVNVEWMRGNNCQRARFKSKHEISGAQTVRSRPVHTEHVDISSIFGLTGKILFFQLRLYRNEHLFENFTVFRQFFLDGSTF